MAKRNTGLVEDILSIFTSNSTLELLGSMFDFTATATKAGCNFAFLMPKATLKPIKKAARLTGWTAFGLLFKNNKY